MTTHPTFPAFIAATRPASTRISSHSGPEVLEPRLAPAGLGILSIEAPEIIDTGATVTYVVTVINSSETSAPAAVLSDVLPNGVTFVSASASQGSASHSGGTVTASLGTLAPGATATVTITAMAPGFAAHLTNTVSITSSAPDPDLEDNTMDTITRALRPGDLVVTDLTNRTAEDLVAAILGEGVTVSNVQFKGKASSAGTFSGPAHIFGITQGIILSSGNVAGIVGVNNEDQSGSDNLLPGDSDLDRLTSSVTRDATVLEFDFVPQGNVISFQYVFSSEEYNEFANSSFNDVFGFFLNGTNVALLPGTSTVVSINTVNGGFPLGVNAKNPEFYINNDLSDGGGLIRTEMDGFTVVLSVQANVKPGEINHIKLAIADVGDSALDSNVLIRGGSFTNEPPKADLVLTLTDTPDPATVGAPLTYRAIVTNNGPSATTNVRLTDLLPPGVTFVSAVPSQGSVTQNGGNLLVNFGTLNVGATAILDLVVIPSTNGPLVNAATVESDLADAVPSNNTATATTLVSAPVGPLLAVSDAAVTEGPSGSTVMAVFTVTLSQSLNVPVTVNFRTGLFGGAHAATPGVDYTPVTGQLEFAVGQRSVTFSVPVLGDGVSEARERFLVTLSGAVGAEIGDAEGVGVIRDDDQRLIATGSEDSSLVHVIDTRLGKKTGEFFAFEPQFKGGVRVAFGDVNGDGVNDIIAGAGSGGKARVRVFDGATLAPLAGKLGDFRAFSDGYRGGVHVAAGDVDGDGSADVIVSPSAGSGGKVRIFSGSNGQLLSEFTSFGRGHGGVRVAAGDVDGDGRADIIAGSGYGASIRVFNALTGDLVADALNTSAAFGKGYRGGLFVAAGDIDGDGRDDIIAGRAVGAAQIRIFPSSAPAMPITFNAITSALGGVRVAASDANGDGIADVIALRGVQDDKRVRLFNGASRSPLPDISV